MLMMAITSLPCCQLFLSLGILFLGQTVPFILPHD